jgi:hypothetical protein
VIEFRPKKKGIEFEVEVFGFDVFDAAGKKLGQIDIEDQTVYFHLPLKKILTEYGEEFFILEPVNLKG